MIENINLIEISSKLPKKEIKKQCFPESDYYDQICVHLCPHLYVFMCACVSGLFFIKATT